MLFAEPGVIGSGGNSGFQAINIAAQFGAGRLLLLGFDMHAANGMHWYGMNTGPNMRNPTDHNYVRWRKALSDQASVLAGMGFDVINTSMDSALECFEKMTVEAALMRWGIARHGFR